MKLWLLYEDKHIVVAVKPPLVYVHPSPGHETGTLTEALVKEYPEMADVGSKERPGVVHRLDAETSGVMVFARTRQAYLKLREQFEHHGEVSKTYLAILHGAPKESKGTLECTIGRKPWDPHRMEIGAKDGKRAITHWEVLGKKNGLALVQFTIETGRTHQIRLVAAHLGCPVVGDKLYGDKTKDARIRKRAPHLLLHAVSLEFKHPITGKPMAFSAPPPPEIIFAV